ncbi:SGNH/GDSL hydrolase family protein [Mesorhizobium sp. M1307]|uniref:SGNH/GDSL hydrolase family protein n=1 Tax=Mesorhizobium sp. M1307 TaxID=2957079 RepID=UPI00333D074A
MSYNAILEIPNVVVVSGPAGQSFLPVDDAAQLTADFGRDGDRAIIRSNGDEWLKTAGAWAATGENFWGTLLEQGAAQVQQAATSAAQAETIAEQFGDLETGITLAQEAAASAAQDAGQTAADRAQTGLDRTQTGLDRTQTGLDRAATGVDAAQTAADRIATTADRAQTTLDRAATGADAGQTALDRTTTAADVVLTHADVVLTHADVGLANAAIGGVIYDTTAAGIAATVNGQFFIVKGDGTNTYALMYKNVATVGTLIASYPSKAALDAALVSINAVLAKIGPETPLYFGTKRVLGGFADSNNLFPLAVMEDGEVRIGRLVFNSQDLQLDGAGGVPEYYLGNRVIGGFRDDTGRYPLAILRDGRVYAPKLIFDSANLVITEAMIAAPSLAVLRSKLVVSSADVACYGDSLTQNGFASALSTHLTGRTVANRGYGSQTSAQIAMRQGGLGTTVRMSGNQIVSGANTITHLNGVAITDSTSGNVTQLLSRRDTNATVTIKAEIAGVIGTVTRNGAGGPPSTSETYTFTPDGGQTVPVTCPPDTALVVQSQADAALTQVIWVGRNDRGINNWSVVANVRLMVARLRAAAKRFVILGIHNGTNYPDEWVGGIYYADLNKANAELAAAFPDNFFDVRRYLIDKGLTDAAITPTATDLTNIANDVVPSSLLADGLHLTPTGYDLVATQVVSRFFTPNGW